MELVRRGLAPSRDAARDAIGRGTVLVSGAVANKPARLVAADEAVVVTIPARFVSRGGCKLDAALGRFDIDVAGRRCLDAGASTGGFTDCLLQRGASSVVAVDVGYGQLHPRLRGDDRVVVLERTDVRSLRPEDGRFEVVVADLSFISLRLVISTLVRLAEPGGTLVVLVKPQFEVGRVEASRGRGVVRGRDLQRQALVDVTSALAAAGTTIMGAMPSPLVGAAGNVEFLVAAQAGADAAPGPVVGHLDHVVDEVVDEVVDAAIAELDSSGAVAATPTTTPAADGRGTGG